MDDVSGMAWSVFVLEMSMHTDGADDDDYDETSVLVRCIKYESICFARSSERPFLAGLESTFLFPVQLYQKKRWWAVRAMERADCEATATRKI